MPCRLSGWPAKGAYEDYHLYLAILFIPFVSAPIVGWLFVPLYHRLKLTSAYEYLELRFDRRLRLFGSLLACFYTLGWMGSMLYATGVILQAVLGLSDWQLTWTVVGLGLLTTFYTSIGGFKAVVWTDVAQSVVLAGGMLLVLLLAVNRIPGGWSTVWETGSQHQKFELFDMRFDLSDRANFFSACAYGVFVYLAVGVTAQGSVQRYVAMPTVSAARRSLVVNGLLTAVVCLLFFLVGSVLFCILPLRLATRCGDRQWIPPSYPAGSTDGAFHSSGTCDTRFDGTVAFRVIRRRNEQYRQRSQ